MIYFHLFGHRDPLILLLFKSLYLTFSLSLPHLLAVDITLHGFSLLNIDKTSITQLSTVHSFQL